MSDKPLNPKAAEWFERRAIDPELVARMQIYTARQGERGEVIPDVRGRVIVFPVFDRGREVNWKARAPGKFMWQKSGGKKTFWNADVLDDPALATGEQPLIITEGEPDALTMIQAGFPLTVSVPDGAPAHRDEHGNVIPMRPIEEIDPESDSKFSYVRDNWDRLAKVKRIILALDSDEQGKRLRVELARRLGESRCYFVEYPDDPVVDDETKDGVKFKRACKDANEVALHHGYDVLREVIRHRKPYPVAGLFKLSDFADNGPRSFYSTGFDSLDKHWMMYEGAFIVMSGMPGSGKSALADQIAYNMAALHGWRVCICTLEEDVVPDVRDKMRGYHLLKADEYWTQADKREADAFIEENFTFITADDRPPVLPDSPQDEEASVTVDWVLDKAAEAVVRDGIKLFIIDPWNEIEHAMSKGMTADEYLNDAIRKVKRFRKRWGVATMVLAHPTKTAAIATRQNEPMTMYDINGGATWANKAEIGVIVTRGTAQEDVSTVSIRKVKFHKAGKLGDVFVRFDRQNRAFSDL